MQTICWTMTEWVTMLCGIVISVMLGCGPVRFVMTKLFPTLFNR